MKVYVYGDVTCRGEIDVQKGRIDLDDVRKYVSLNKKTLSKNATDADFEALDDFLDSFEESQFIQILGNEKKVASLLKKLENGEGVSAMGEEELYGYGKTKTLAKVAYAESNANDCEDW